MYEQVDLDVYPLIKIYFILDYNKGSNALQKGVNLVSTPSGRKRKRKSTIGWKLVI